jgi:hypothetical protein
VSVIFFLRAKLQKNGERRVASAVFFVFLPFAKRLAECKMIAIGQFCLLFAK